MDTLEDLSPDIPVTRACDALGASRATLYRRTSPPTPPTPRQAPSQRALSTTERQRVVDVMHSPEFVDQPPREIYAALLSMGIYLASVSTMYRLLKALSESGERRPGHQRTSHAMPQLEAHRPNQIWTWDITKVHGPDKGVFYFVYLILDLFSRFVVGWMVAETENAKLASHFLGETITKYEIPPGSLTVHSDRGSPMKAGSMTQLFATLGVEQSFSRPRVSNDNPFVESSFKTAKYQPDYPGQFSSSMHVQAWFAEFFDWQNDQHHHQGLALFTPSEVFHGRVHEVATVRQAALDAIYEAHPERFVGGRPVVRLPPNRVHINLPLPYDGPERPPSKTEVLPTPIATNGSATSVTNINSDTQLLSGFSPRYARTHASARPSLN